MKYIFKNYENEKSYKCIRKYLRKLCEEWYRCIYKDELININITLIIHLYERIA